MGGGPGGDRTRCLLDAVQASSLQDFRPRVVAPGGIEPPSVGYQPTALPLSYGTGVAGTAGVEPARLRFWRPAPIRWASLPCGTNGRIRTDTDVLLRHVPLPGLGYVGVVPVRVLETRRRAYETRAAALWLDWRVERPAGFEPASPGWRPGILAAGRRPQELSEWQDSNLRDPAPEAGGPPLAHTPMGMDWSARADSNRHRAAPRAAASARLGYAREGGSPTGIRTRILTVRG